MNRCRWIAALLAFSGLVAVPGILAAIPSADRVQATVCVGAGRRVSVSGCANIGDAIARYAPPPGAYAPLPEDDTTRAPAAPGSGDHRQPGGRGMAGYGCPFPTVHHL
jgi:hypothetical protein